MVNAIAKTDQKSSAMVQDLDAYYPKGYCPSHNTFSKMYT